MIIDASKYIGLKVPSHYDVRYKTFYADLYDINTKSYLGTCKVMNGVTVDFTRWADLNGNPDVDLYVGDKIIDDGSMKFTVVGKSEDSNYFSVQLSLTGSGTTTIDWGPGQPTQEVTLGNRLSIVGNRYVSGSQYQINISGENVEDVTIQDSSTGIVNKVIDFGKIGLKSLKLYSGDTATYSVVPATLPSTITSLRGFCAGMVGLKEDTFKYWQFVNVENLDLFLASVKNSEVVLDNKNFVSVRSMDGFMSYAERSTLSLTGTVLTSLENLQMMATNTIDTKLTITDVEFPQLSEANYWIAGSTRITVNVSNLILSNADSITSIFGETTDANITVDGFETPWITEARRTFSSLGTTDTDFINKLKCKNWNMDSCESMYMTFSGWHNAELDIDLTIASVNETEGMFSELDTCKVTAPGLTVNVGGNILDVFKFVKGVNTISVTDWTVEGNSNVVNLFTLKECEGSTLDFSGLTLKDNVTVSNLAAGAAGVSYTANDVSVGNNVSLLEAMADMTNGSSVKADRWVTGQLCDVRDLLARHFDTNLDLSDWTIGAYTPISGFAKDYTSTTGLDHRILERFNIGESKFPQLSEEMFANSVNDNLTLTDWIWDIKHSVVNMFSGGQDSDYTIVGHSWSSDNTLTNIFSYVIDSTIDVSDWITNGATITGLESTIGNNTTIVGIDSWL